MRNTNFGDDRCIQAIAELFPRMEFFVFVVNTNLNVRTMVFRSKIADFVPPDKLVVLGCFHSEKAPHFDLFGA